MYTIRQATISDIHAITDIYNDSVLTTDATFDIEPRTEEEQTAWFHRHGPGYPVIVAEAGSLVTGWASLSKWSDRLAYTATAEISVYVREGFRNRGIGRKLMEDVIARGREAGLHTIIGRIVAGNGESIHLHEALGFTHIGVMKEVGSKFGRLLDVHILQKIYTSETGREDENE